MSSQLITPNTESAILARLIQSREDITHEVAQFLLSIDFESDDLKRMDALSEQARKGSLTPEEEAELDSYLHVGSLLSIMQSRARRVLKSENASIPS